VDKLALSKIKVVEEIELPVTKMEKQLAEIWSNLLNVDVNKIGRHSSFFALGGDSISAIQFVTRASSTGISGLSSALLFKKPTLSLLGAMLETQSEEVKEDIPEFEIT
jgi:aryl carrier-like protein